MDASAAISLGDSPLPIGYTIYKQHRLVVSTRSGRLTTAEIRACMDQGRNDPDFNPGFNQLVDWREVTFVDMSGDETRRLANIPPFSPESKRAVVAPDPAVFGMGRMFATYHEMSNSPSQLAVFYDLASALTWLGIGNKLRVAAGDDFSFKREPCHSLD